MLFGSAFWGCLYTGLISTVFVGGFIFLVVWHVRNKQPLVCRFILVRLPLTRLLVLPQITRPVLTTLIAQLIGISVTIGLKWIILRFLRCQFNAAFYRKQVAKDNFMNVVLECWNIAISSGFMLVRSAQLLLVTACYLGRLDTPLLASGVGVVYGVGEIRIEKRCLSTIAHPTHNRFSAHIV